MRVAGLVTAAMIVEPGCGPGFRTGQIPPAAPVPGGSLTDAERGFLILTKTEQGREILQWYFPDEYLEYLSGNPDAYARLNPIRASDGLAPGACDNLDGQHKKCKHACLAAFGACEAGAAAGCALTGPAWPECWAFQTSAACIPAILLCLKHCSDVDDRRHDLCRGGRGT